MAARFVEGFGKYGPTGTVFVAASVGYPAWSNNFTPVWNWWASSSGAAEITIQEGAFGAGSYALRYRITSSPFNAQYMQIGKTNLSPTSRLIAGFRLKVAALSSALWQGICFIDGTTGQLSVGINGSGYIEVKRGYFDGTLLATSTASVLANAWNYIEADVTFHNSTGAYNIYLNGVSILSASNVDTCFTANNQAQGFILVEQANANGGYTFDAYVSDVYLFDGTGTTNNAPVGDSRAESKAVTSDYSVGWAATNGVLGDLGALLQGAGAANTAPGANQLALRKTTSASVANLDSVSIYPAATSATAKFTAVIYADNGSGTGPTGAPIATGTEVVGCTASTVLVLPFGSPPALTAGTIYWIGYITDTSVALWISDNQSLAYKAANTYTNGAPTSPSMTSAQPSWNLWGNLSGVTSANWSEVNFPGMGDKAYILGTALDQQDLYNAEDISGSPTNVWCVGVTAFAKKTDAGLRQLDLRADQDGTTTSGTNTLHVLTTSYAAYSSYFPTDPSSGVAWTYPGFNSARFGVKITG